MSEIGRIRTIAQERLKPSPAQAKARAETMSEQASSIIGKLDSEGRWVKGDMITCESFISNTSFLCTYLELLEQARE